MSSALVLKTKQGSEVCCEIWWKGLGQRESRVANRRVISRDLQFSGDVLEIKGKVDHRTRDFSFLHLLYLAHSLKQNGYLLSIY